MKKPQIRIALFALLSALLFWSNKPSMHTVYVNLLCGDKPFLLNDSNLIVDGEALVFTRLRFYLSQIQLYQNDSLVWQQNASYHLVDAENEASLRIDLNFPEQLEFNELHFLLGVDSATSTSGAMGGDLDPSKGMFWTWNSGYINFKLEGQYAKCPTRKNAFQYHIGGYKKPYETAQKLRIPCSGSSTQLNVDLAQLVNGLDLEKEFRIMSPGQKAQELSKEFRKMFVNAIAE